MADIENVRKILKEFDRFSFNFESFCEEFNITQEDVDELRQMAESSSYIPKACMDRGFLFALITCDNDKEKSLKKMEVYCKFYKEMPEFFSKRDVTNAKIQHALDNLHFATLSPTPDNYHVILHKLSNYEPENYNFNGAIQTLFMTITSLVGREGPRKGFIILFDYEGSSIGHAFRASRRSVQHFFQVVNEGCPFKIHAVHVLNTPFFMQIIMNFVKPFMGEIVNVVHLHSRSMDMEEFYQEHIPKSSLPSDYGGDLESIEVLHNKNRDMLMLFREVFLIEDRLMNFEFDGFDLGVK